MKNSQPKKIVFLSIIIVLFSIKTKSQNLDVGYHTQQAYELEGYKDDYLYKKAESIYMAVLLKDSLNLKANRNLGALYYNKAINLVKEIKAETTDKKRIEDVTEEAQILLLKSKPYLERYKRLSKKK